jgi:hypothetical protein
MGAELPNRTKHESNGGVRRSYAVVAREPLKSGAVILMQDSESQLRGASMWMRSPLIWKVTPLPVWAAVVAISSAAIVTSFFVRASWAA